MTSARLLKRGHVAVLATPSIDGASAGRRMWLVLRWLLLLAAVGFVISTIVNGWPEIVAASSALADGRSGLVVVALGLEMAWVMSLAQVYRSSLKAFHGQASFRQSLRVSMGAFTLSRVLPGGGAVGSLFAAREFVRVGNHSGLTLIALVSAGWVSLLSLSFVVLTGIGFGVARGSLRPGYLLVPAVILGTLATVGALVAFGVKRPALRRRISDIAEKMFGGWGAGMTSGDMEAAILDKARPGFAGIAPVILWSAASWILDAAALWMVFAAFGHPLDVGSLFVGYGVANLIQALPELTPGWLGVLETSLSVIYAGLGVPAGVGVIVVLGYRMVSFWLPVAAGLPFAWSIIRRHQRLRPIQEPV